MTIIIMYKNYDIIRYWMSRILVHFLIYFIILYPRYTWVVLRIFEARCDNYTYYTFIITGVFKIVLYLNYSKKVIGFGISKEQIIRLWPMCRAWNKRSYRNSESIRLTICPAYISLNVVIYTVLIVTVVFTYYIMIIEYTSLNLLFLMNFFVIFLYKR